MITATELERVLALAEHRHFGRAAEALGITQPALTRSIANLEESVGGRVVDRGRWGVELTAIGRLIVDRGREILRQSVDLETEIDKVQGLESGELTVTIAPYPAAMAGQAVIARMARSHPGIRYRVRASDWRGVGEDVLARRCEIGLADVREARSHPALETETVGRHQLHFFCRAGHDLLGRGSLEIDDLLDYPWAATRGPANVFARFPRDLGMAATWEGTTGDLVPSVALDVVSGIARIAVDSEMVIAAPLSLVESELASGDLVPVPLATPWFHLEYGLIYRERRTLSAGALAFADCLTEIERENEKREAILHDRYWRLLS